MGRPVQAKFRGFVQNVRSVVVVLVTATAVACGAESHPVEPVEERAASDGVLQLSTRADLAPGFGTTRLLATPAELRGITDGKCLLERIRPTGRYTRVPRALGIGTRAPTDAPWRLFYFRYVTYEGTVIYRATCRVPHGLEAEELMLGQVYWIPGEAAGASGQRRQPTDFSLAPLASSSEPLQTDCVNDNADNPCELDGLTVTGEDPCPNPGTAYDAVQGTCVDIGTTGGASDGGTGGSTGGGSGGASGGGAPDSDLDASLTDAEIDACRPDLGECTLVYDPSKWEAHESALVQAALDRLELTCSGLHGLLNDYKTGWRIAFWRETVTRYGATVQGRWDFRDTRDIWLWTGATRETVIHETVHAFLQEERHTSAFYEKLNACK